jgi:nucleoside phosphorylase
MEGRIIERMMRDKSHPPGQKAATVGHIGHNKVVLLTTGMGPRNAKIVASQVLRSTEPFSEGLRDMPQAPNAVLITGLAGSLVPWIGEGDIVIYENCLSEMDKQTCTPCSPIPCSPDLIESMTSSLGSRGLRSKIVTGITSPRIAQKDQDRARLAGNGAAVVDMESFQMAACSAAARVPVAVIRAISDSPGSRMPDLNRALTPRGDFDRWTLAGLLVGSPFATARLFKASRRAIAALEQALGTVLSSFPENFAQAEAHRDAHQGPEALGVLTAQASNMPTHDSQVQE